MICSILQIYMLIWSLDDFCKEHGLLHTLDYDGEKLKKTFDYHLTVFYCDSNSDIEEETTHIDPCVVDVVGYEFLGKDEDIPTLELKLSDELLAIKNFYEKVYGLKSDFPDFKPHISLSYDKSIQNLSKFPEFPIVFDKIYVEVTK